MAKRLLTRSMDVSSTIAEAKKALRARVRQAIAALTPQECLESDRALFDRFLSLPQVQAADTLFCSGVSRDGSRRRSGWCGS